MFKHWRHIRIVRRVIPRCDGRFRRLSLPANGSRRRVSAQGIPTFYCMRQNARLGTRQPRAVPFLRDAIADLISPKASSGVAIPRLDIASKLRLSGNPVRPSDHRRGLRATYYQPPTEDVPDQPTCHWRVSQGASDLVPMWCRLRSRCYLRKPCASLHCRSRNNARAENLSARAPTPIDEMGVDARDRSPFFVDLPMRIKLDTCHLVDLPAPAPPPYRRTHRNRLAAPRSLSLIPHAMDDHQADNARAVRNAPDGALDR